MDDALLWEDLQLTLLWGRSAARGPQVVQHSCMGTAVLHNLCGSAAVAKLQLPSSQPVQALGDPAVEFAYVNVNGEDTPVT